MILPNEQWRPAVPDRTNTADKRATQTYMDVCQQFDVERTQRYQPTAASTFCNIYVNDCTSAMDAIIPHWVDLATHAPCPMGHGVELSANATVDWLVGAGTGFGWSETDQAGAQANASAGCPTVAVWKNPLPGHSGHVVMVMPTDPATPNQVMIAQAGAHNYFYVPIAKGFGGIVVRYFKHA